MINVDETKIKEFYENRECVINDRSYRMHDVSNKKALKIIGLSQQIGEGKAEIGSDIWNDLEEKITTCFSFEQQILSKIPDHFENHKQDYFMFMGYAMAMIAYPFTPGSPTA